MFNSIINGSDSNDEYIKELYKDYNFILENHGDDENKFQDFFEKNPCLVPNDDQIFGESGHSPYLLNLITQPVLAGLFDRKPDFLWFGKDSMNFRPVFIEIEAPNKKIFNKNRQEVSTDFKHSRDQLCEWQMILSKPQNQLKFFDDFNLPLKFRNLNFKPSFVLIYGRRDEFENDDVLMQKRAFLMGENQKLLSFDRLDVNPKALYSITSSVKNGKYYAKYVSPALKISSAFKEIYKTVLCIDKAISDSVYLTPQRKAFMIKRINEIVSEPDIPGQGIEIKTFNLSTFKLE